MCVGWVCWVHTHHSIRDAKTATIGGDNKSIGRGKRENLSFNSIVLFGFYCVFQKPFLLFFECCDKLQCCFYKSISFRFWTCALRKFKSMKNVHLKNSSLEMCKIYRNVFAKH